MKLTSWKTTLAGVAALLTSLIGMAQHFNDGTPIEVTQHVTEIMIGIGLLFAKDNNVTGGTRETGPLVDSERGSGYGRRK